MSSKGRVGNRATNFLDPGKNPCIEEQKESMACLEGNNYKKSECTVPFVNYQDCIGFWKGVSRKRNQQGIIPSLPPPSEQKQIKEYLGDKLPYISLSETQC